MDARLYDWPDDIDADEISEDVDEEAFLRKWDEHVDDHKPQYHSCILVGKRSLERRCTRRRSLDPWYDDIDPINLPSNITSMAPYQPQHSPEGAEEIEKRNPFALLFQVLANFAVRLGLQIAARATASIASTSSRLATLLKNPNRLFQIAQTGKGTPRGPPAMNSARQAIKADSDRWRICLKDGLPL